MDDAEKLRARLLTYPGATKESVDAELLTYEQREDLKATLVGERQFSNAMAESFLEKKGYPRPPGWHSVFFYPGGNRPRNRVVVILIAALVAIAWYFSK